MRKHERELRREFEPLGIKIELTKGNHIRLTLPNGRFLITGSSPSDWRVMTKLWSDVRRSLRECPC